MQLGDRVKDQITGIEGTVVGRTSWLYRTAEIALSRDGVDADGRPWDLMWIDAARCALMQDPK